MARNRMKKRHPHKAPAKVSGIPEATPLELVVAINSLLEALQQSVQVIDWDDRSRALRKLTIFGSRAFALLEPAGSEVHDVEAGKPESSEAVSESVLPGKMPGA